MSENSNQIALDNNRVSNTSKAYEMAIASNELRSEATKEKAIAKVLLRALLTDTDPASLPVKETNGFGLGRQIKMNIDDERYDQAVDAHANNTARERTMGLNTTENIHRVMTVTAAQKTIQTIDRLNEEAGISESVAAQTYEADNQRDPSRLATSEGREAVAQELLRKL